MKSSESSRTSMIEKKRSEIISPKSYKSYGNYGQHFQNNYIRCFYCTKDNFMSLEQLTHHINLMHSQKLMKEQRKNRSEHESPSHHHHDHEGNFHLSCEFCLMKFSSSENLIKHIGLVHHDKMRATDDFFSPTIGMNEQSNDENGIKNSMNNQVNVVEEQPTDLSQRVVAKKIKIENYEKHFDHPLPPSTTVTTTIKTPGTPDAFLCNQCNASLPSFELFRLHLKNHLEKSYGKLFFI